MGILIIKEQEFKMNELTTVNQAEINNLFAQTGGNTQDEQIRVPFLQVQYDSEDKQGRDVKRGYFRMSDQEEPVYADTIKIRVLAHHFQYRHTDPDTYKVVNKSILLQDLRYGEARDMAGTIRCGKPTRKALEQLPKEKQAQYDTIRTTRILRGICSYTGTTVDGTEVVVENAPFQFFMKGLNFMGFESVLKALPHGKKFHDFHIDLSNRKDGKAFITEFKIDFDSSAIITNEVVETLKVFAEMARIENQMIEGKYREALTKRASTTDIYSAIAEDAFDNELDADLA
jgi:hypothetical protein